MVRIQLDQPDRDVMSNQGSRAGVHHMQILVGNAGALT
jgi:hypothetical protein